jgi:hypothetical protein
VFTGLFGNPYSRAVARQRESKVGASHPYPMVDESSERSSLFVEHMLPKMLVMLSI